MVEVAVAVLAAAPSRKPLKGGVAVVVWLFLVPSRARIPEDVAEPPKGSSRDAAAAAVVLNWTPQDPVTEKWDVRAMRGLEAAEDRRRAKSGEKEEEVERGWRGYHESREIPEAEALRDAVGK